ncbi:MAG: DUF1566 domain-containing protein, partial [Myxococcales bacterium]|nr:DUF1566 domain-containing protein [Myxococcales bacterium]
GVSGSDAGVGGAAGSGGAVDAGPCPNGVQGGDGTVAYPRWATPTADTRAASEFSTTANTALDHATCLMWQRNVDANLYTVDEGKTFCQNLVLDGLADWRLPTRAELISLTDFSAKTPAIESTVFPGTEGTAGSNASGRYWSSTDTAWDATKNWVVTHGAIGQASFFPKIDMSRVRCVRGKGAPTGPRFVTGAMGVVVDNETGLWWEEAPPDADHDPTQAKAHCDALLLGGHDDWRLPSVRELQLLVDPSISSPALPALFTSYNGWFWTSSPVLGLPGQSWGVQLGTGYSTPEGGGLVYTTPRVRCVR